MMRDFGESAPAEKPSGCLKYFLYAGCAALAVIAAWFVLIPAAFVALLFYNPEPEPGWEKTLLPEKIRFSKVLLSQYERGGFLEGCTFAAYRLAPNTIRVIEKEGSTFFKEIGQPPGQRQNFYGPWKSTPVPDQPYIFATGAMNGCGNDNSAGQKFGRMDFLSEPGNFYALTENREGIIVVSPKRQLVVYAYFG